MHRDKKKSNSEQDFETPQDPSQYHGDPEERSPASRIEKLKERKGADMPDERNDDIISEQTFSKEQTKRDSIDDRRFKVIDAIENRDLPDREPLQPLAQDIGFDELDASVSPQADSPGDSEADATAEFLLGINFRPESEDPFEEEEDEDDVEDFEKTDHTIYAEQKSGSAGETPSLDPEDEAEQEIKMDDSTQVVSSGRPSPRSDATRSTSSN